MMYFIHSVPNALVFQDNLLNFLSACIFFIHYTPVFSFARLVTGVFADFQVFYIDDFIRFRCIFSEAFEGIKDGSVAGTSAEIAAE